MWRILVDGRRTGEGEGRISMGAAVAKQQTGTGKSLEKARRRDVGRRLLRWYDRHRRDLPWRRRGDDPYAQLLAELMLQQTQVATVVGYYERFICRFPTIETLATADIDEVLKDRHFKARGFFVEIDHPIVGKATYPGLPFRLPATASAAQRPAPTLGQHNREVYVERLGYGDDEMRGLHEEGVI